MDGTTRLALEALYTMLLPLVVFQPMSVPTEGLRRVLRSAVVELAAALGKPCPIVTRSERRGLRVP